MSVLVAQEFERVRREIDQHQDAIRPQHPRRLGDCRGRTVGVMQHLMDHNGVERGVRQIELVHVAEPDRRALQSRAFEIDPRDRQHLARLVDAERALDSRPQDFKDAAGPGPDIEQVARVGRSDDLDEIGLDFALVDIERANAMPLNRVFTEIGTGEIGPLPLDRAQTLQIESDHGIILAACGDELAGECAGQAGLAETIKDPASLAEAVEQPGLAQELQVARHPRLALPEDLGQLADRELPACAKHDQP